MGNSGALPVPMKENRYVAHDAYNICITNFMSQLCTVYGWLVSVGRGRARAYGYQLTTLRNNAHHLEHALQAEDTKKVHCSVFVY